MSTGTMGQGNRIPVSGNPAPELHRRAVAQASLPAHCWADTLIMVARPTPKALFANVNYGELY
jgi:hypothetical protein